MTPMTKVGPPESTVFLTSEAVALGWTIKGDSERGIVGEEPYPGLSRLVIASILIFLICRLLCVEA